MNEKLSCTMDERYLDQPLSVGAFDVSDRTKTWWRKSATSADTIIILAHRVPMLNRRYSDEAGSLTMGYILNPFSVPYRYKPWLQLFYLSFFFILSVKWLHWLCHLPPIKHHIFRIFQWDKQFQREKYTYISVLWLEVSICIALTTYFPWGNTIQPNWLWTWRPYLL